MGCKLVDFGNAAWGGHDDAHEVQTRQYRAPEVGAAGRGGRGRLPALPTKLRHCRVRRGWLAGAAGLASLEVSAAGSRRWR